LPWGFTRGIPERQVRSEPSIYLVDMWMAPVDDQTTDVVAGPRSIRMLFTETEGINISTSRAEPLMRTPSTKIVGSSLK
jgi:hypothetical protein